MIIKLNSDILIVQELEVGEIIVFGKDKNCDRQIILFFTTKILWSACKVYSGFCHKTIIKSDLVILNVVLLTICNSKELATMI